MIDFTDSWTAYCAAKPRSSPYDLQAWLKAARTHFDEVRYAHYAQWRDATANIFFTGYPRLEGDPPHLRLIQSRPFRQSLLDHDGWPPTDDKGFPLTFYNPALCRRLCQILAEVGHYKDPNEAYLFMILADRYLQRPDWVIGALTNLLYIAPPPLPADFGQQAAAYFATASLRPIAPVRSSASHQPAQLTLF